MSESVILDRNHNYATVRDYDFLWTLLKTTPVICMVSLIQNDVPPDPVSYTHLDVYKRQVVDGCGGHGRLLRYFGHVQPGIGLKFSDSGMVGGQSLHDVSEDDASTCLLYTSRCV